VLFSDRVFIGFFLRVDSLWPLVQSSDGALFQPQQKAAAEGIYCGSHADKISERCWVKYSPQGMVMVKGMECTDVV